MATTITWTPDPKFLESLCTHLQDSSCPNTARQRAILEQLDYWSSTRPDYCLYLAWIFSPFSSNGHSHQQCSISLRVMAGLLLKNELSKLSSTRGLGVEQSGVASSILSPQNMTILQHAILQGLCDPEQPTIRTTAGTLISSIVSRYTLSIWPNIFDQLYASMQCAPTLLDSIMSAISKICEDCSGFLVTDHQNLINALIPALLDCIDQQQQVYKNASLSPSSLSSQQASTSLQACKHAIQALNQFIFHQPPVLTHLLNRFVDLLSRQASISPSTSLSSSETHLEVQQLVCKSLVSLFESYLTEMLPIIPSIMDYMMNVLNCGQEELALEACEFWLSLSYHVSDLDRSSLDQIFPKLLPMLFRGMIYSDQDPIYIEHEDELPLNSPSNNNSGDKSNQSNNQIAPRHYHSTADRQKALQNSHSKPHRVPAVMEEGELEDDNRTQGSDDEQDGDEEDEEGVSDWNLRKCSAATLDALSGQLTPTQVHQILLPLISQYLNPNEALISLTGMKVSDSWKHVEVGILALGAIAPNCLEHLKPHLTSLLPLLIQQMAHPRPLIRSISSWTLSRFSTWVVDHHIALSSNSKSTSLFESSLSASLQLLYQDKDQRSKGCAIHLLSALSESAQGAILYPYLDGIWSQISATLMLSPADLPRKSFFMLIDFVTTLGAIVGRQLSNNPAWMSQIFPILMNHLHQCTKGSDMVENYDIFPILEALTCLILSFGPLVEPYVKDLYDRACRILYPIQKLLYSQNTQDFMDEDLEEDLTLSALELLGALVQVLPKQLTWNLFQQNAQLSLHTSNASFLASTFQWTMDEKFAGTAIRQTAFGLFGDFCVHCPESIQGLFASRLHDFFQRNLVPTVSTQNEYILQNGFDHDSEEQGMVSGRGSLCVSTDLANNVIWSLGELALAYPKEFESARSGPNGSVAAETFIYALVNLLHTISETQKLHNKPNYPQNFIDNVAVTLGRLCQHLNQNIALATSIRILPYLQIWASIIQQVQDTKERESSMTGICHLLLSISHSSGKPDLLVSHLSFLCELLASWVSHSGTELKALVPRVLNQIRSILGPQNFDRILSSSRPDIIQTLGPLLS
jgi:hypothetical protein